MRLPESPQTSATPVYLVVHASEPMRTPVLKKIEQEILPAVGLPAFNHATYRAGDGGLDALSTAQTLPMMASKRLVEIRDLQEGSTEFFVALLEYIKNPPSSTVLLLTGPAFPKVVKGGKRWSTRVEKAIRSAGGWVMDRKKTTDPLVFVMDEVAAAEKTISRGTARRLVDIAGSDLGKLRQEVAKLVLYIGDAAAIQGSDIDETVAVLAEAVTWDLVSAMFNRDRARALTLVQRLQDEGTDSRALLGILTWKLRGFSATADALRRGASEREAQSAGGLRSRDLKQVKEAMRLGFARPHVVMHSLARANYQMNSHRAGDRRILERFVLDWLLNQK